MLCVVSLAPAARAGEESADDLLFFPEYRLEIDPEDGVVRRAWRRTANESLTLVDESLYDTWAIARSPLDWRWREWLTLATVAGGATALIYLADEKARDAAVRNEGFRDFGGKIGFLSDGTTFGVVTGGFALSGMLFREDELETARMLIESVSIGYATTAGLKHVVGRARPGPSGPRDFDPFSSQLSMPSGETTHAFAMASIVAERYPSWPVRILSYGLAATVAAGRIARDDHWTSDVFVGAVVGTFVGRSVAHLHRERARRREQRARLGLGPERLRPHHMLHVGARSIGWTVRY